LRALYQKGLLKIAPQITTISFGRHFLLKYLDINATAGLIRHKLFGQIKAGEKISNWGSKMTLVDPMGSGICSTGRQKHHGGTDRSLKINTDIIITMGLLVLLLCFYT